MTDQKPTGVFVRLPLSDEQIVSVAGWIPGNREELRNEVLPSIFSAIGSPVHGDGIPVVGTIHIGENGKPFFTAPELYSTGGDVVRQSDALAKLAEKDAEITRKDEEIERIWSALEDIELCIDALPDDNEDYSRMSAREMRRQALEVVKAEVKALKGPKA